MKSLTIFALGLLSAFTGLAALPPDYEALKADAEKSFGEQSFARAHELYGRVSLTNLPPAEQRWVEFRLADTQWRSEAATQSADTTRIDEAQQQLDVLVRDPAGAGREDRDSVWVAAQESLGDFFWTRRNSNNWGAAWPHYQQALDWWAGARDIEPARQHYLDIVWRMAKPPQAGPYYYYGYWGNSVPLDVLNNALQIALRDDDKAHAHFLIAMTLRNQGGAWQQQSRVADEFEGAIKIGKSTEWYDDALYHYAEWMAGQGRIVPLENGAWRSEPDYARALELFRRLVSEFNKGETRYWEQAQQQIKNITDPQLGVAVPNIFLPESEIQYVLNWRNVKQIELALYPVELNRDASFPAESETGRDWLSSIDLAGREKIKSWTYEPPAVTIQLEGERTRPRVLWLAPSPTTGGRSNGSPFSDGITPSSDRRGRRSEHAMARVLPNSNCTVTAQSATPNEDYAPGNQTLRLDGKLKPGAYVLEVRGGGKSARDLILVSDAALVLKTSGRQALVYVCSALDGSPLAKAKVKLWESWWEDRRWHSRPFEKAADQDGLAVFDLESHPGGNRQIFVSAIHHDRQTLSAGSSYWQGGGTIEDPATGLPMAGKFLNWQIYACTDRPAYRPEETVSWKFIARCHDGSVYSTPSDQTVEFEITDPRGAKVKSDQAKLNAFGSAWGTLELTKPMPLGEYHIAFWDPGRKHRIGGATLFRLEEYKLPEFKVTVQTPTEDGRKKAFRLGEPVEVTLQADYYFGGPVAAASVEVLVHQNPCWQGWREPRNYPWFYEDMDGGNSPYGRRGYGGDQIIRRETLKTDATGKATVTFDTPANDNQDYEYRIEARVTDASRREITGSGTVRVTRQRYYVYPQPEHNLYRPRDQVKVKFKALDANEQPVPAEGRIKVTRDYWFEIWLAPDGHEVKGEELKRFQSQNPIWPPRPARPDQRDWRMKFQGYEHDDILTRALKTDSNGEAELTFTPEREGYYRVAWTSEDTISNLKSQISNPISAETTVWVANNATSELGYRHGGVEIIADKDTFRVGQRAPVMLVAPAGGRYVLFSVEGEDLYSWQLVHLDGTVKLLELPVEEKHVPNIFLNADLVSDRQIFTDTKQIIVPPTKNFLTVDVKPDRTQYLPRDEGTFTITTRNDEGKPVSAEIAFGLVDESVYYIQNDFAGDPRQFFFGTKRAQQVQTQSTMNQKSYAKLVAGDDQQLMDEQDKDRRERQLQGRDDFGLSGGGGGGGAFNREDHLMAKSVSRLEGDALAPSAAPAFGAGVIDMAVAERSAMTAGLPPGQEPAVQVRTDFRSTVFWQPDVITDKDGKATVKVKYPDSLTGWKATARAVSADNQFGIADTTVRTRQPLIVRLEAPRFFVVGDTVTISAVVNNNTEEAQLVRVPLVVEGIVLLPMPVDHDEISVPAKGEARVDWKVSVPKAGAVKLLVKAIGPGHADAMEKTFVAYEHGIEKFISKSGKAPGDDITVKLELPHERKPDSTMLTVQITPSLAVTMLDALPYLVDYPYGCTEQTMSRFLPAVITAKTLRDLGLRPEDVMGRVFGGIETNSAAATHPKGKKDLEELDKMEKASLERLYNFQHADGGWGWWKQGESDHWMTAYVVWGLTLARDAGIRVKDTPPPYGATHGNINPITGSPEPPTIDPVTGLPLPKGKNVLERGANYLDKTLVEEEENPDMQAFMLHALAANTFSQKGTKPTKFQQRAFDNLWTKRDQLNAYTRALLALSAHSFGYDDKARILVENLENGVKRDDQPDTSVLIEAANIQHSTSNIQPPMMGTAHWGEDGVYWRWSDGGVEATAFALRALLAIDPTNKLVEPVTNWLIKNRRGAQWNSTRDTAIAVLALNDYLRTSGELQSDVEYELIVNGISVAKRKISGADVFDAPSRFAIAPELIKDSNEIRIRLKSVGRASPRAEDSAAGQAPGSANERGPALYFAVEGKFFSTEEPIAPAGNEIFVKREYYKLTGRPTLLKGYVYDRVPLKDGGTVKSGERVETVLTLEAKNNYEYLLFEDLKPAGFEAAEIRSGEPLFASELKSGAVERKFGADTNRAAPPEPQPAAPLRPGRQRILSGVMRPGPISRPQPVAGTDYTGRTRWVYQELRDRKVALFIDKLPQGVWEIRYNLRAEVPGQFHALPVVGQAMYVPEIRCNGAEIRINVEDAN